jgi:VIT1/CCC1 family predicted Fe2+/Mn2+ transporter
MPTSVQHDPALARALILDELFDLTLYRRLRELAEGEGRAVLDALIRTETEHFAFWQKFFDLSLDTLDLRRRLKLHLLTFICRIGGSSAINLVLEAIEVYGARKYLLLWETYKDEPTGAAIADILIDEFQHEDTIVTRLTKRQITPEKIRNIFLGMNDGLVEILGAVSGFFAAFGDTGTVLIAALTTAVAGSLSMGAGAYAALNSEQEVQETEAAKKRFLGEESSANEMAEQPMTSAFVVGCSYMIGAMVPVLPVLFGARDPLFSMVTAGSMIIAVSTILAFLSGMNIKRRIVLNLVIIAAAVGVTYIIGTVARRLWGIAL